MKRAVLAALALLGGFGCQPDVEEGGVAGSALRADSQSLAKRFGEAVLDGNWTAAYALTTADFRKQMSVDQMTAGYAELAATLREQDSQYLPDTVEVHVDSPPGSMSVARDGYGIPNPPPQGTWRSWSFVLIGQKAPGADAVAPGVNAKLLIVDDAGTLKIAWVAWELG